MRRVFIIAKSEFQTAVRARGFLVGIMLMPILFGGAVVLQRVVERQANQTFRRVAVLDNTGRLFAPLQTAVEAWNRGERDLGPKVAEGPQFTLESIAPPAPADRDALLLSLSQRVRTQDLFAFVELPARPDWRRAGREDSGTTLARLRTASCPTGCSARCSRKSSSAVSSRRTSARSSSRRC